MSLGGPSSSVGSLSLLGSVIDITDNFEGLNAFVLVGDTPQQAFMEKVIGFLGGFVLLSIGFFANMNHELCTPLTGVIGMSTQLKREPLGSLNEKQHEYLSHIVQSSRRVGY